MTFKVIRGQGQSKEMTSVPYRDYFFGSPVQCTNHNVETADQISVKFVGISISICRTGTCLTIQSYSPGGATLPDCFASFSNPVAVTTVVMGRGFLAKLG